MKLTAFVLFVLFLLLLTVAGSIAGNKGGKAMTDIFENELNRRKRDN